MAAYPEFDVNDLADFSGRDVSEYSNPAYAATAIYQAQLLFDLGTCLNAWPDDSRSAQLATMAVLSMADAIYLVQPFQAVISNPFSSETIGSYSYSKVAGTVAGGLPTGITWFDIALSKLSVCDLNSGIPEGGGIEVFEDDGLFTAGVVDGNVRLLSPEDFGRVHWRNDPAPGGAYELNGGGVGEPNGPDFDGGEL